MTWQRALCPMVVLPCMHNLALELHREPCFSSAFWPARNAQAQDLELCRVLCTATWRAWSLMRRTASWRLDLRMSCGRSSSCFPRIDKPCSSPPPRQIRQDACSILRQHQCQSQLNWCLMSCIANADYSVSPASWTCCHPTTQSIGKRNSFSSTCSAGPQ